MSVLQWKHVPPLPLFRIKYMPNMTAGSFWQQFANATKLGEETTTSEYTTHYVTKGEDGTLQVGRMTKCLHTGTIQYALVVGPLADMVIDWYRKGPQEESRREVHLLVRTMIGYGERALKLGCNLSTLHEAIGNLRRCSQELKLSQVLRTMGEEERKSKSEEDGKCPKCGSGSYECIPCGTLDKIICARCKHEWMEDNSFQENSAHHNSAHVSGSEREENSAHAHTGVRSPMREGSLTSAERALEEFITGGRPSTSGSRRIKGL